MSKTKVISLGGSIVAPEAVDTEFIGRFRSFVTAWLEGDRDRRIILIVGGGGPARRYQEAYRRITEETDPNAQDWIGITATRLNAQLIKGVFGPLCREEVVINPEESSVFTGQVLVGAGWKPGFSTDFDAVVLAERHGADTVINLSNIAKVYTDDPKNNPDAQPIDRISWHDFQGLVGDEWSPGRNLPFDPVATRRAAELGLTVICAAGRDIDNTRAILSGEAFEGTQIGPS